MKTFLIIRFSSLGDIILTSAFVTNLRANYPSSKIVFLTKEKFIPLVKMIEGVDEIRTIPDKIGSFTYYKFLLELDKENFEAVYDLHGNFRSWLARKMVTASQTYVYPKRRMERINIVKQKKIPETFPHTIDLYNDCIKHQGGKVYCQRPVLKTEVGKRSIDLLKEKKHPLVVLVPGAAHKTKQYPIENFGLIAKAIYDKYNCTIIWAATSDEGNSFHIEDSIPAKALIKLVDYPIKELAYLISQSDLTISNDSGVMHLSSSVGTPTVAIFGPTHPALGFSPRGLQDQVVQVDEKCRPCSLHGKKECYREQRYCFNRISPEMVIERTEPILNKNISVSKAVFIDRDGTIIKDKHFLSDPDQLELIDGAIEGLKILKELDYKIVIVSNQSGVARGYFDLDTVEKVNNRLIELLETAGIDIDGLYYCPHYPGGKVDGFNEICNCRKPSPGMPEEAAVQLNLDLRQSIVIGDKIDDWSLGKVIGAESFLVRTGYGAESEKKLSEKYRGNIYNNLLDVCRQIERQKFK